MKNKNSKEYIVNLIKGYIENKNLNGLRSLLGSARNELSTKYLDSTIHEKLFESFDKKQAKLFIDNLSLDALKDCLFTVSKKNLEKKKLNDELGDVALSLEQDNNKLKLQILKQKIELEELLQKQEQLKKQLDEEKSKVQKEVSGNKTMPSLLTDYETLRKQSDNNKSKVQKEGGGNKTLPSLLTYINTGFKSETKAAQALISLKEKKLNQKHDESFICYSNKRGRFEMLASYSKRRKLVRTSPEQSR